MHNFDNPTAPVAVTKIRMRNVFQKAHMTLAHAKSALRAQTYRGMANGEMALYTPGPDGAYMKRLHIRRGDDIAAALEEAGL